MKAIKGHEVKKCKRLMISILIAWFILRKPSLSLKKVAKLQKASEGHQTPSKAIKGTKSKNKNSSQKNAGDFDHKSRFSEAPLIRKRTGSLNMNLCKYVKFIWYIFCTSESFYTLKQFRVFLNHFWSTSTAFEAMKHLW